MEDTKHDNAATRLGRPGTGPLKVDLHVHTCYSGDSLTSLEEVIATALERGLDALAILDHDTIEGALALQATAPFPVIVGEEVMSNEGEIAGLFLQETIPPSLTPTETVRRIHAQGGLVYIPHPFDSVRSSHLRGSALEAILGQVDAIEVLNARVVNAADNQRAQLFAQAHGLPGGAGSDAHAPVEIGRAYVELAPFHNSVSFRRALTQARVCGGISAPHVHLYSTWAKIRKHLGI